MHTMQRMMLLASLAVAFWIHGVSGTRLKKLSKRSRLHADDKAQSKTMDALFPFYHTTSDLHQQLMDLSTRCQGMTVRTETMEPSAAEPNAEAVGIDVVSIKAPGTNPTNKNFYLFGEHARELISPESGLHLIRALCGETDLADKAKETLKDNEFEIVLNGNPRSRSKVEQGDFCLRVNENGVDLNRNWDEKWEHSPEFAPQDTNPGPSPFSEPETKVFKKLVSEYDPTNFLTVHSGTRGMYMPWAYDMEHLAQWNQPEMMQVLKTLDTDHCQCPFGAAGKEVGYPCPGTCLDWVYEKLKTPYSFAFEIYIDEQYDDGLKERFDEKLKEEGGAFYQVHSSLAHRHFKDIFTKNPTDFVQLRSNTQHQHRLFQMQPDDCFKRFNPDTEDKYNSVVHNWADAYLDLANLVAHNLKKDGSAGGDSAPETPSDVTSVNASAPDAMKALLGSAAPVKTSNTTSFAFMHGYDWRQ